MEYAQLFLLLLFFHFVADFPLQGDWLAKAKNPFVPVIPGENTWVASMFGHSYIHAFAVWFATGSYALGAFELVAHFVIDTTKCAGRLSYSQDQALHILCKLLCVQVVFLWNVYHV